MHGRVSPRAEGPLLIFVSLFVRGERRTACGQVDTVGRKRGDIAAIEAVAASKLTDRTQVPAKPIENGPR